MRIVIEVADDRTLAPAGMIRWEGHGAEFHGWIELLRLLESALRLETQSGAGAPQADRD